MHLKSSNGAPINVLVLNQDEDVATMVPVPKYSRTGRQHTHVGQQEPTQEMADLEKDLQQEGNMDVRTDDLDRVKRTDETESPMDVDESPSEGPDRRGAGVSQRSLEAIVEKLHKDNEEKSNGHEDELESDAVGRMADPTDEFLLSPKPIPVLQLSPAPGERDYFFHLDEKEGITDLYDLTKPPVPASN